MTARPEAARFLFVTWAGGGNSTPVLGLATRLVQRGHEVLVVSPDGDGSRFDSVGLGYRQLDDGSTAVKRAVERVRPDRLVVDFMMPGWLSEAEATGRPTTALVHTLYDRVDAGILTAFTTLAEINEYRRTLGLDPVADAHGLLDRCDQVLVTAPRALDTSTAVRPNVRFVGAVLEEPGPDTEWVPRPTDVPLVVVAMGTTEGLGEERVLPRVLDALEPLPVTTLVNLGAHVDPSILRARPDVVVSGYVRHAVVMRHAALVVTHAGLGTVVAALSAGVPLVCLPLGRDQPHNAARVEAVGAGLTLDPDASADQMGGAVTRVLGDARFRTATAPFRAAYDPEARAAIAALEETA